MELWASWIATILFGYFAITSLYAGVKPYKKDEERGFDEAFSYGDGTFAFIGVFFEFILWVSEKLFPPRFQLLVFRVVALMVFVVMTGIIYLFWYLYFK